jgi:cell division protein FtsB
MTYLASKKQLQTLTSSNEKIENTNDLLETENDKLRNDDLHIESIARKDYKMVKEGETVYIFNRKE